VCSGAKAHNPCLRPALPQIQDAVALRGSALHPGCAARVKRYGIASRSRGHHTMTPLLATAIDIMQVLGEAQGAVGCCDRTHQNPSHQESVGFVLSSQLQRPLATG
jgi:hypothetical protein